MEHQIDRTDLYRFPRALVDHFIARYPEPPAAIVLDIDHADDPTYGQQEFACSTHPSQNPCDLPLFICEGTSHALVTAYLRPGTRPTGAEHALVFGRLLSYLRRHWPDTHILGRGDSHGATPEVRDVIAHRRWTAFGFGLAGNAVLLRQAAPPLQDARRVPQHRVVLAQAYGQTPPTSSRLYDAFDDAAGSWAQSWRVVRKAAGRSAGENPRFVVTSLAAPTPQRLSADLSWARGHCENALKAVKTDLRRERTSATTFLAQALRLLLAWAAYALHHALRTPALQHTGLAPAQPSTILFTLCKIATQVKQYKARLLLHLPSSCPVKALLQRRTAWLCAVPGPMGDTSSAGGQPEPARPASQPVRLHR